MAFDLTSPEDVDVLQTHLAAPDTVKVVDALLKSREDAQIADWYNTVQETLRIPRGTVLRSTFVGDCQRLGVWSKLMTLAQSDPVAFAGWAFYLDKILPLLDSFDVNGATFQAVLPQLRADGLIDDAGILSLTTRSGSPAEALFGAGSVVNTSGVSAALGSVEPTALSEVTP